MKTQNKEQEKKLQDTEYHGADYIIKGVHEDDISVMNRETGYTFGLSKFEFTKDEAESLREHGKKINVMKM